MVSERDQLACLVQQWNENRLDLFHLSYPTEDLEIEGVMRFYFQDGGDKVLTKCVRVSSTATTRAVVDALQEKFLPDLKMLSNDNYSLWEVHENGEERLLDEEEKPLLVQLMWHKDDREGRFLLRKNQSNIPIKTSQLQEADAKNGRFSKKKEKELRRKHQQGQHKDIVHVNSGREEASTNDDIYKQVPFNTFTRTISNPEAVMRKRREKKLETKLKEMTYGGSLKIFGAEIVPSRPYVTILAGMHDTAEKLLNEALEKYGLDNVNEFVLVEITTGSDEPRKSLSDLRQADGRPIHPHECPLVRMAAESSASGFESYLAIKRKPHDYQVPSTSVNDLASSMSESIMVNESNKYMPSLIVVNGGGITNQRIVVNPGLTEVGSDREMSNFSPHNIYLDGIDICGRHAAIANMDGVVTLTPSTPDAYIELNGAQIMHTEILRDGDTIRIGRENVFRFRMPEDDVRLKMDHGYRNSRQQSEGRMSSGGAPSNYSDVPDSRASTTRCGAQSDYGSLPFVGNYYPPSVSGSSDSSSIRNKVAEHRNGTSYSNALLDSTDIPISIQIGDYNVWDFLGEVMSSRASSSTFRLSPAYALYLAVRFFRNHTKPYLVQFLTRIETNLRQIAMESSSRDDLIFWLANASEFAHLIDKDVKLSSVGNVGAEIERLFRKLVVVVQSIVRQASRKCLDTNISDADATNDIINVLDSTLRMARNCRLNPALTIQFCGHMLHTINANLFNSVVAVGFPPIPLTSRLGRCLQSRLDMMYRFCEGMGVELAAECHLDRIRQTANLLAAAKNDVATLGSTCYKLNSFQVVHILSSFEAMDGEVECDDDVIDRIVRLAEKQADQLTVEDGQRVTLEESDDLSLPFLVPQDGYFVEQFKQVPEGLWAYLMQLQNRRLCHSVCKQDRMTQSLNVNHPTNPNQIVRSVSQTTLTSIPTTQFGDSFGGSSVGQMSTDSLIHVILNKNGGGIGLSIVAAQGVGDRKMGIYVKKVVDGTPAALDGRLETGDQLLSVNGQSLVGISQEEAARLMTSSSNEVHFEVRKRAAHRNGLSAWLVGNGTPNGSHAGVSQYHQSFMSSASSVPSTSSSQMQAMPPPPAYSHVRRDSSDAPPPVYNTYGAYERVAQRSNGMASSIQQQRHARSSSASDLANEANASFSSSVADSARSSVFDKLPAHYRHSTRPTVIQPARPAQSPSALRRGAPSPASSTSTNLYRPTSASNLFAPPPQKNALVGYTSNAVRESMQDLHRAMDSPLARSTPNDEPPSYHHVSRPSSLYQTATTINYCAPSSASTSSPPRVNINTSRVINSMTANTSANISASQEPAIVRGSDAAKNIKGAVPTAITQALQLRAANNSSAPPLRHIRPSSGGLREKLQDADVRQLEKTNTALMSYEAVNEELDRLDAKGHRMTEQDQKRYRELLNVAAEQSRARRLLATESRTSQIIAEKVPSPSSRTETMIDDIPNSSSSIENVSPITPPESRQKVQFIEDADVPPLLDSPGIVGTGEIYRDPRQRRLNEIQASTSSTSNGESLAFREKQRLFARQLGEQDVPKQRIDVSSAQRQIETEIVPKQQ